MRVRFAWLITRAIFMVDMRVRGLLAESRSAGVDLFDFAAQIFRAADAAVTLRA